RVRPSRGWPEVTRTADASPWPACPRALLPGGLVRKSRGWLTGPSEEDDMPNVLILGGGTAGTMLANKLRRRLPESDWEITIVDRDDEHHYQPGYLSLPF